MGKFLIKNLERILEDGQWHTFVEIEEIINLSETSVRKIAEFLNHFEIADINVTTESLRLNQFFLKLPK